MINRSFATACLLLLLLTGISLYSISLIRPPEALPVTAPADQFSAGRAMQYVRRIAREPHAVGTPAHAVVRTYLLDTMQKLGLQPIVQEATAVDGQGAGAGYVYNIMGRLKGKSGGKAVLLMAHYDSQPNALGAGDDGAGVASLLETARAIQQGGPLQHDVIFLLTDGEEAGLFGARAFMRHPWAKEIGFVINIEARGNSGPSMTFEISPQNGWVVNEFSKAAPYPFASSLMYEVYKALPNNTDFTIFREAGYSGVNSAIIDGFANYHKLTDSPENLDINSLQHHGSNALALTRQIANGPLTNTKADDKVFFNPAGSWLVQYPMGWNWVWMVLLTAALIAVGQIGIRKRVFTVGKTLGGLLFYVLMVAAVVGFFLALNPLVRLALPYSHWFKGIFGSDRFLVAYTLLTVGVVGLVGRLAMRWVSVFALQMGVYLFLYLLTLILFIGVPSATYQFLFPLLFCLIGFWFVLRQQRKSTELTGQSAGGLVVAALPALFMLMPLVRLLFVTFDLQLPVASMGLLTLVLGLVLPVLVYGEQGFRWRNWPVLPLLCLLAGAGQTIWAIWQEAPSAEQPLSSQVSYYLNADTKQAYWSSDFKTTDDWNRQFFANATVGPFRELYPTAVRERLKSRAVVLPLAVPTATVIRDTTTSSGRQLTLRLHSNRGAAGFEVLVMPNGETDLKRCAINDQTLTLTAQKTNEGPIFSTQMRGLPLSKEATLQLTLTPGTPVRVALFDGSIGLPTSLIKTPRPASVMFEQGPGSNQIIVRKTYSF